MSTVFHRPLRLLVLCACLRLDGFPQDVPRGATFHELGMSFGGILKPRLAPAIVATYGFGFGKHLINLEARRESAGIYYRRAKR